MKWRLQQLDGFGPVPQVKRKSLLVLTAAAHDPVDVCQNMRFNDSFRFLRLVSRCNYSSGSSRNQCGCIVLSRWHDYSSNQLKWNRCPPLGMCLAGTPQDRKSTRLNS